MLQQLDRIEGWQTAEALEARMPGPDEWRARLGLERDEIIPIGRVSQA